MREMVGDFFGSRYSSCLTMLRSFGTELIFDVHVSPHLDELQHMIRNRALIQYISPYTRLDLRIMARAFNTDVSDSEKEVAQLIVAGRISARIDSVKKLLIARQLDERSTAFGLLPCVLRIVLPEYSGLRRTLTVSRTGDATKWTPPASKDKFGAAEISISAIIVMKIESSCCFC